MTSMDRGPTNYWLMSIPERDLGTMGEALIQQWCAQVGIIANKSTMDKAGWDYVLEFPLQESFPENKPLDLIPPPVSCLLQIKSSVEVVPSVAIKVSNWHRMISDSRPVFVVFLSYPNKNDCEVAHILHVDEGWIEKVLKRCRELEEAGAGIKLHKHNIVANARDGRTLDSLDGEGLKKAIQEFVGSSMDEYAAKKIWARNSIGYDEHKTVIRCQIERDPHYSSLFDQMMDFALRRVDRLSISSAIVTDKRFGIESKKTEKVFSGGGAIHHAENTKDGDVSLTLRDPERGEQISLRLCLFLPHGIPVAKNAGTKVRIATQFIEVILPIAQEGTPTFAFNLPKWHEKTRISELEKVCNLIHFLSQSNAGQSFDCEFFHNGNRIAHGCIQFQHTFSKDVLNAASSILFAGTILRHMNSNDDELVRIGELAGQMMVLKYIADSLDGTTSNILISYSTNDRKIEFAKSIVVPDVRQVFIGEKRLLFGVAIHGKPGDATPDDDGGYRVKLFPCKPVVCIKEMFPRSASLPYDFVEFREKIVKLYEDSCDVLVISGSPAEEDPDAEK